MLATEQTPHCLVVNINVGILGHVDSGKTSLVKALSTQLSTAALDKHPQSKQRGITLDLGFSAFTIPVPDHLRTTLIEKQYHFNRQEYQKICQSGAELNTTLHDRIQFTLVDCPGHASLIRTIIGGAQIIDMIILVVDANKGIQAQTAECIVIGEITTSDLIIVLNKIDTIPEQEREEKLKKMTNRLTKVFSTTKFKNPLIIPTAACVGGEKSAATTRPIQNQNSSSSQKINANPNPLIGIEQLVKAIQENVRFPTRNSFHAPFYYAIDHCFPIKGHGTVLTGTVLSGSIAVNTIIELPSIQVQRKVKSMQMFHNPVKFAQQGDRVGICVSNLDHTLIERSIAAEPNSVPLLRNFVCLVKKVRFFKSACKTNSKYHVTIGHSTVVATAHFYGAKELTVANKAAGEDTSRSSISSKPILSINRSAFDGFPEQVVYPWDADFEYQDELLSSPDLKYGNEPVQWAFIQLHQPLHCPIGSLIIASKLDSFESSAPIGEGETQPATLCRLAFFGPIIESVESLHGFDNDKLTSHNNDKLLERIRVFHWKFKDCKVFKVVDVKNGLCRELIGSHLISDTGNNSLQPFIGMILEVPSTHPSLPVVDMKDSSIGMGQIVSSYGSDGKFRVKFPGKGVRIKAGATMVLRYKRFIHDKSKRLVQTGMYPGTVEEEALEGGDQISEPRKNDIEKDVLVPTDQSISRDEKRGVDQTIGPSVQGTISKEEGVDGQCTIDDRVGDRDRESGGPTPLKDEIAPIHSMQSPVDDASVRSQSMDHARSGSMGKTEGTDTTQDIRIGSIESLKSSIANGFELAIVQGCFTIEENIRNFIDRATVLGPNGEIGEIIGPFGKMGKCKVRFSTGCPGPEHSEVKIIIKRI